MYSDSRPAGHAHWAVLSVIAVLVVLAPLSARSCCDALTHSEHRSSSTVDSGSNVLDDTSAPVSDSRPASANEETRFSDTFFQCYADSKDSALSCVGEGARVGLESFFSKKDLQVSEGLSLVQEAPPGGTEGREVPADLLSPGPPFDGQHRSVVDSAAAYLSARAIRWDMSGLYPGLVMRVGPTLTGTGMLEFVMEPRRFYSNRELGPSKFTMRRDTATREAGRGESEVNEPIG